VLTPPPAAGARVAMAEEQPLTSGRQASPGPAAPGAPAAAEGPAEPPTRVAQAEPRGAGRPAAPALPTNPADELIPGPWRARGMTADGYRRYLRDSADYWNRRAAADSLIPALSTRDQNKANWFNERAKEVDAQMVAPAAARARELATHGVAGPGGEELPPGSPPAQRPRGGATPYHSDEDVYTPTAGAWRKPMLRRNAG
jgi:hypothetical protein